MLSLLVIGWASLALGVTVTALLRPVRVARRRVSRHEVLLVRPVDAPTAQELENLAAPLPPFVQQVVVSGAPLTAVQGLVLPSDPRGENRKLGHVQHALSQLDVQGRVVMVVDADVKVDRALLFNLLGALDDGADCAWATPRPLAAGLLRGILGQSLHNFAVLDAITLAGARPLCGKAMALSPRALELVRELPDCVGEDLELGQQLHAAGLRVSLRGQARMPGAEPGWNDVRARFTRWMQVLRAHRPGLFPTVPVFFACTPVLLALSVLSGDLLALELVFTLVLARTVLALRSELNDPAAHGALWWLPGELLLLTSWLGALCNGSSIRWRGRTLHLLGRGLLAHHRAEARP